MDPRRAWKKLPADMRVLLIAVLFWTSIGAAFLYVVSLGRP